MTTDAPREPEVVDDEMTLTATVQDYLKAIWSATEWGGPAVTTKALAERFGISSAAVSETVKRLSRRGLIDHEPYRAIVLTAEGERHAVQMVRRHRLIETFLVSVLDYGSEEVHDEAEILEHWVSDTLVERIDAYLGHPDSDPHGDPIPSAAGHVPRPADAVSLAEAPPGRYEVVRVSDADADRLIWFLKQGITPGAVLEVGGMDEYSQTTRVDVLDDSHPGIALAAAAADAVVLTPRD